MKIDKNIDDIIREFSLEILQNKEHIKRLEQKNKENQKFKSNNPSCIMHLKTKHQPIGKSKKCFWNVEKIVFMKSKFLKNTSFPRLK